MKIKFHSKLNSNFRTNTHRFGHRWWSNDKGYAYEAKGEPGGARHRGARTTKIDVLLYEYLLP